MEKYARDQDADDQRDVEHQWEILGYGTSGFGWKPVCRDFGLAVQNEWPADSSDYLSHDHPGETWVHKHSQGYSNDAEAAAEGNPHPGAISVDNKRSREGEDGMHESEKQCSKVDDDGFLIVDDAEGWGDGGEGVEQDGDHELGEGEQDDNEEPLGVDLELIKHICLRHGQSTW